MPDYTREKIEYDELTRKFFSSRGYETHILGRKHRYPDLVAWNSATKKFAVVEVKGPKERSARTKQSYRRRDYNLNGISRKEVRERLARVVDKTGLRVAHLVGVTISNQLYCYYWDALEKRHLYANAVPENWRERLPASLGNIETYLVTPLPWRQIFESVLTYFRAVRLLPQFSVEETAELCVARIFYPQNPPIDLARPPKDSS